jgi:hypothetical protein
MKHVKIFLIALTLSGCASWGQNLGEGVSSKFQSHADSIVVAKQINAIPDKQSYDDLTKKISANSKQEGVEEDLRVFLAKNIPAEK